MALHLCPLFIALFINSPLWHCPLFSPLLWLLMMSTPSTVSSVPSKPMVTVIPWSWWSYGHNHPCSSRMPRMVLFTLVYLTLDLKFEFELRKGEVRWVQLKALASPSLFWIPMRGWHLPCWTPVVLNCSTLPCKRLHSGRQLQIHVHIVVCQIVFGWIVMFGQVVVFWWIVFGWIMFRWIVFGRIVCGVHCLGNSCSSNWCSGGECFKSVCFVLWQILWFDEFPENQFT